MSIAQDITRISVQGQKESVIRMLNAVLCNLGVENSIVAEDSVETINHKIKDEHDGYGFRIRIPDLLETEMLQMPEFLNIKEDFESKMDKDQDNFTAPAVDILTVRQAGDDYVIDFELYECEPCYYVDWIWWDQIAKLYRCKVYVDDDLYYSGKFYKYCGAIVFEPDKDGIRRTEIKPELDLEEYKCKFDALIKINPERYRPLKILNFKDKIKRMQKEILLEEAEIERDYWAHESAKDINKSIWTDFFLGENKGPEDVRSTYDWYLDRPISYYESKILESLEDVLILRKKKWEGVDETMFDCYSSLISDFREAAAVKELEYKKWKIESDERDRQNALKLWVKEHEKFLQNCAKEEPEVCPLMDLNEEDEEEIIGYEYVYYIGESIDEVEYLNEYSASRDDEHPESIFISFRSSRRSFENPYERRLCECSLKMTVDQSVVLENMSKSAFFDLLNLNVSQGIEPLSKETPMTFTSAGDYDRRFKELGFEILNISDYVAEDVELPF